MIENLDLINSFMCVGGGHFSVRCDDKAYLNRLIFISSTVFVCNYKGYMH